VTKLSKITEGIGACSKADSTTGILHNPICRC
jgi:hypothetical protein